MAWPITSLTAALLGLGLVALSLFVSFGRRSTGIDLGDGDNPLLSRRIRVHANFIETVPIPLVLLALFEAQGPARELLWITATLLVCGRAAHVAGMLMRNLPLRAGGMLATHAATAIPAFGLLAYASNAV